MERLTGYLHNKGESKRAATTCKITRERAGVYCGKPIDKLAEYEIAEEQGLIFNITSPYDSEELKDIIHSLIQNYVGVPVPKNLTDSVVDNLVM